jgi:hypothetical protein
MQKLLVGDTRLGNVLHVKSASGTYHNRIALGRSALLQPAERIISNLATKTANVQKSLRSALFA